MSGLLEVCVDSLASARAAIAGGADRLELCSALAVGGLTPYTELLRQIRSESDIAIRCLIRPRGGDFLYTKEEIAMLASQIENLGKLGADGFVIGCLNAEGDLDFDAMQQAAAYAVGEHDFAAFKAAGSKVDSTVRTIFRSEWTKQGNLLHYDVEGNGFLYNMVRILVGTMLDIGLGRSTPESMKLAVEGAKRSLAGPTAPPEGLALVRVRYQDFDTADYVPLTR